MVSIILSCYNSEKYLREAITSVLQQEYKDIELIFVDDGSTDNSLAIAKSLAQNDDRLKIIRQSNCGLNSARNFGAKNTSLDSEALVFFDADDILDKKMISCLYNELYSENNIGAAYCTFKYIDENGVSLKKNIIDKRLEPTKYWVRKIPDTEKFTSFFSIYSWTLMAEACTMIKKEIFLKFGGWDEKNFPKGDTYGESIPLFGKIALHHKVIFMNEELYLYRRHSSQITSGKRNLDYIQTKINNIMLEKNNSSNQHVSKINTAIKFNKYRLPLYNYLYGPMKHEITHSPLKAFKTILFTGTKYFYSLLFDLT